MPHISQQKMEDKDFNKIYDQLLTFFDTAGNNRKSDVLFSEFFTKTEKIMFAKRLAILCLVDDHISEHYISYILKVSPSTINRIRLNYEIGKYPYLTKLIKKNKETVWAVLGGIIRSSGEKYIGKKRWEWLNDLDRKYDKKLLKS